MLAVLGKPEKVNTLSSGFSRIRFNSDAAVIFSAGGTVVWVSGRSLQPSNDYWEHLRTAPMVIEKTKGDREIYYWPSYELRVERVFCVDGWCDSFALGVEPWITTLPTVGHNDRK